MDPLRFENPATEPRCGELSKRFGIGDCEGENAGENNGESGGSVRLSREGDAMVAQGLQV